MTLSSALADGTYTLIATAQDLAGNVSAASGGVTLLVDTTVPSAPTLTGTSPINTSTPQLTGTAEADAAVAIYSGVTSVGQATAGSNGLYSVTISTLSDGSYSLTAKATDSAGNVSAASSGFSVFIPVCGCDCELEHNF